MHAWYQYKKTLVPMQVLILGVTAAMFFWSHVPQIAGTFFVTMQAAALMGAAWGARLRKKVHDDVGIVLDR